MLGSRFSGFADAASEAASGNPYPNDTDTWDYASAGATTGGVLNSAASAGGSIFDWILGAGKAVGGAAYGALPGAANAAAAIYAAKSQADAAKSQATSAERLANAMARQNRLARAAAQDVAARGMSGTTIALIAVGAVVAVGTVVVLARRRR